MKSKNLTYIIFAYIIALLLFAYFFQKEIKAGLLRFFRIKAPLESFEYYRVKEKINYNPDCQFIVSCSLFGDMVDAKIYKRYFLPLLRDGPEMIRFFPESNVRIYADPTLPGDIIRQLAKLGFEIHLMNYPSRGFSGSFWRALAFEDKSTESTVFISDTDPIFHKHLASKGLNVGGILEDWRKTDKRFLVIGSNLIYTPFSINRLGMRNFRIENMEQKINLYEGRVYGEDEVFMIKELWPIIKKEGFIRYEIPNEQVIVLAVIAGIIIVFVGIPYLLFKSQLKKWNTYRPSPS